MTARQLLNDITKQLAEIPDAAFDAGCILSQLMGKSLPACLLQTDVSPELAREANALAARRCKGEPLQYLLGEWEFYGLRFYVGEGVLIPRPDTETLVETVMDWCRGKPSLKIADLCTGSGCIALTLASLLPDAEIYGIEKSPVALAYAEKNKQMHGYSVTLMEGDVLCTETAEHLPKLDVIVSNPPYLNAQDMGKLQTEVRYEPKMALDGGKDGFRFYRGITEIWKHRLRPGGLLAFEAGIGQAAGIAEILEANGFTEIRIIKDLCGVDRVVAAANRRG